MLHLTMLFRRFTLGEGTPCHESLYHLFVALSRAFLLELIRLDHNVLMPMIDSFSVRSRRYCEVRRFFLSIVGWQIGCVAGWKDVCLFV